MEHGIISTDVKLDGTTMCSAFGELRGCARFSNVTARSGPRRRGEVAGRVKHVMCPVLHATIVGRNEPKTRYRGITRSSRYGNWQRDTFFGMFRCRGSRHCG